MNIFGFKKKKEKTIKLIPYELPEMFALTRDSLVASFKAAIMAVELSARNPGDEEKRKKMEALVNRLAGNIEKHVANVHLVLTHAEDVLGDRAQAHLQFMLNTSGLLSFFKCIR